MKKSGKKRLTKKRGGERVLQGAETCIFWPVVACKPDANGKRFTDTLGDRKKREDILSRIMSIHSNDVKVEKYLSEHFSPLMQNFSIVVGQHYCTPDLQDENNKVSSLVKKQSITNNKGNPLRPCDKITKATEDEFVNIITKSYNENDFGYFFQDKKNTKNLSRKILFDRVKNALNAAVKLVPDNGPWVIHCDLHPGNILLAEGEVSGLADWGRSIIIQDPNNLNEIFDKLLGFLNRVGASSFKQIRDAGWGKAAQHTNLVLQKLQSLMITIPRIQNTSIQSLMERLRRGNAKFTKEEDNILYGIECLRGWNAHAIVGFILNETLDEDNEDEDEDEDDLLICTSQSELAYWVNYLVGDESYITL